MASALHVLKAVLQSDMGTFAAKLEAAAKSTEGLGRKWAETGQAIERAALRVGTAVVGMGATIAATFGKFEATMVRAGAVTRTLGTRDFQLLEDAAKRMGETTVFSASQAAGAIEVMGLAGLKTTEILEALPGALQLAAAGSVDIATAANSAAKIMRAFGADATELTHINDVLVGTFTRANTDLLQLAESMKHVAPVSKAMGVSLEDTAAVLAKMADAGFTGSMAGTSLRNIITRMAGAVPAATKQLRELGVETLDTAGKMRPLLDIMSDIERMGLTEAELLQIFGARGGPQLLATLEVGTKAVREFSSELNQMGGIAQEVAEAQLNTLSGAWKLFVSQVEAFLIESGEQLAPKLREAADAVQKFLAENKTEIVKSMVSAVRGLTTTFTTLVQNSSSIIQNMASVAQVFGRVAGAVLNFAATHPQITAWLAAWKVASILGITNAITQLGGALISTVKSLVAYRTAATAAAAAGAAANAPLLAMLGPVGIFAIGAALIWAAVKAMEAWNQEVTEAAKKKVRIEADKRITVGEAQTGTEIMRAQQGPLTDPKWIQIIEQLRLRRENAIKAAEAAEKEAAAWDAGVKSQGKTSRGQLFSWGGATEEQKRARSVATERALAADKALKSVNKQIQEAMDSLIKEAEGTLNEAINKGTLPEETARKFQDEFFALLVAFRDGSKSIHEFAKGTQDIADRVAGESKRIQEDDAFFGPARQIGLEQAKAAEIERQLAAQGMEKRKAELGPEFERVAGLMAQENLSEPAVKMIAESIEGATAESTKMLVDQFQVLRDAGEMTRENIDYAVMVTLEAIKAAQEKTLAAKTEAERVQSELLDFRTDVAGSEATDAAKLKAQEGAMSLGEQYSSGAITLEVFRQKLAALRQELQDGIAKTQAKTTAEEKLSATVGTALSGFNAKVEQMGMTLPVEQIDHFKNLALALGKAFEAGKISLQKFKVQLQDLAQQAGQAAGNAGKGIGKFFGGGGGGGFGLGMTPQFIGGAWDWQRQIQDFFGGPVQDAANGFRDTIENTDPRPMIQRIYDSLTAAPQSFSSVSGHTDSIEAAGAGGQSITVSLPNINKISNTDISKLASMIQMEMQRRGRPTF